MTKAEFLDRLKVALNGKISASLLGENMTYYSEYIDSQIYLGKSEQEVTAMLGDPRLIARTIVQTNGINVETENYEDSHSNGEYYSEPDHEVRVRTVPSWVWAVVMILIVVCIIGFVFSLISFLLPLVFPVLIVLFFVKLFRDWLK